MRYELALQIIREDSYNAIANKLAYDRPSGRKLYTYDNANGNNNTKMKWILGMPLTAASNLFIHNSLTYGIQHKVSLEDDANLATIKKTATVRSIDDDIRLNGKRASRYSPSARVSANLMPTTAAPSHALSTGNSDSSPIYICHGGSTLPTTSTSTHVANTPPRSSTPTTLYGMPALCAHSSTTS